MNREDAEEFTQSLGQIVGGSWRQIALAKRLGVPRALGMDTDDWVRDRLGGYVRLSVEERREAVKELTANGHSQREVGEVLGVGQATVSRDANGSSPHGIEPTNHELELPGDPNGSVEQKTNDVEGNSTTCEPDTMIPILADALLSVLREKAAGLTRNQVRQLCDEIARRWRPRTAKG